MSDPKKHEGSGKSPTKFMERKPRPEEQPEGHPEFINDDLDALENQEKQDEEEITKPPPPQVWNKPGRKGTEKPDPRKFQDPEKTDSSSEDKGGDAC